MVYRLIEKREFDTKKEFILEFADASHPIFKAHFPNYPLLPGFMQIDIAAHLLSLTPLKLHYAKFSNPIFPNDKVVLKVEKKEQGLKVTTTKDGKKCGEFVFE